MMRSLLVLLVLSLISWGLAVWAGPDPPQLDPQQRDPQQRDPQQRDPQPANPAAKPTLQTKPDSPPPPMLEEILEIRRQQGTVIQGTLLEKLGNREKGGDQAQDFLQALQQVASPPGVETPSAAPNSPVAAEVNSDIDDPLAWSMLTLCQLLEQRASRLDFQQRDDEADRLRRLARRIRREARQLRP